ncbi:erythroblast NAD(P)(+)--arginine ADP-ribosyltransferase-like [Prinia subflava]|uniref:erythroblast NAD(P)(+)--arginine ADP-ribosyltransferase-like n=1 Tax=Prinia subflava TaxID=208062 RepID=UPI002FE18E52
MAPLSLTLALLAMAVATVANDVERLDMAQDSFDDQYRGCGPAMTAALPALNRSDFQQNPLFARAWLDAVKEWQNLQSPLSPLLSPAQTIALMAYTMNDLHREFNTAVRVAGRSRQHYRDNFHFKTLHFLLTQALVALRGAQKGQCLDVFRGVCGVLFKAQRGDTVRFGNFASTSLKREAAECFGKDTFFEVRTCHGAFIQEFSRFPDEREVLIPPYETFEVVKVTEAGNKAQIQLRSTGTSSKYNCEWLKGGSIPSAHFHFRGLLLATTALAVATGVL